MNVIVAGFPQIKSPYSPGSQPHLTGESHFCLLLITLRFAADQRSTTRPLFLLLLTPCLSYFIQMTFFISDMVRLIAEVIFHKVIY